jgi:hypothetical protein
VVAQPARVVAYLVALAFFGRLVIRLASGEAAFLTQGYSLYLDLATNALRGQGLCLEGGVACAVRLPVYPVFLMPWVAAGAVYPGLVMAQAAVGAATVWLAWRIGHTLFDQRVGVVAALLMTVSPYALIHDTSMQDTVLVNFLLAASAYLLWRARTNISHPAAGWLAGGLALAVLTLTTGRLAFVVPAALVWVLVSSTHAMRIRVRHALLVAVPVLALVGAWVVRNQSMVGAPVLTTEAGESLWLANNEWAMAHFPAESIDLSVNDSYDGMTAAQRASFAAVEHDEVVRDQLLKQWAIDYAKAHPGTTIANGLRKIWVVVSAELSPARGALMQWSYALLFAPVHILAVVGLWRQRLHWRVHALTAGVLAAFAATSAIFWAHTSHKSCLDVFLFVYAAGAFSRGAVELEPAS